MRTSFELKFVVENLQEASEQVSRAIARFVGIPEIEDIWSKVDVEYRVSFGDVKTFEEIENANLSNNFIVTAHVVLKNTLLHPGVK